MRRAADGRTGPRSATPPRALAEVAPSGTCRPGRPSRPCRSTARVPTARRTSELANGVHHNGTAVGDAPTPAIQAAQLAPRDVQHVAAHARATLPRSELLDQSGRGALPGALLRCA